MNKDLIPLCNEDTNPLGGPCDYVKHLAQCGKVYQGCCNPDKDEGQLCSDGSKCELHPKKCCKDKNGEIVCACCDCAHNPDKIRCRRSSNQNCGYDPFKDDYYCVDKTPSNQESACQATEDICTICTNLPYNNISDEDPIYYKYPPVGCSIYQGCQVNMDTLVGSVHNDPNWNPNTCIGDYGIAVNNNQSCNECLNNSRKLNMLDCSQQMRINHCNKVWPN